MKNKGDELNKDFLEIFGLSEKEAYEVFEFVDKLFKETNSRFEGLKKIMKTFKGNKRLFAISYYEFKWGFATGEQLVLENIIFPATFRGDEA